MELEMVLQLTTYTGSQEHLISALIKLRGAALLMIIATLLITVGIFAGVFSVWAIWTASMTAPVPHPMPPEAAVLPARVDSAAALSLATIVVLIVIGIAGFVLALIAVYGKLLPAAEDFTKYSHEFSTSASLIKIGYIVGLILGVVGALTLIFVVGAFLLIVAWIFLIIGKIGLAILCFKINDKLKSGILVAAGILFILSLIPALQILSFIGWILVYIEAGSLLSRVAAPQTT